jgi:hypothetical protein
MSVHETHAGLRFKTAVEHNVSARDLFICGALLFPAFLFQSDLAIRAAEVAAFFLLGAMSGRKIRILSNLIVSVGIVAFNLVIPAGRVLVTVLGIPITDEALRSGVSKATAVIGMIAISQISIRRTLRLPGTLGGLVGRTFLYFERIMGERKRLGRDRIMERIDQLLMSVHGDPEALEGGGSAALMPGDSGSPDAKALGAAASPDNRTRTTPAGFIGLGIAVAVAWGLLVLTRLHPGLIWAR